MRRRVLLANLVMVVAIAGLTFELDSAWAGFERANDLQAMVDGFAKNVAPVAPLKIRPPERIGPFASFLVVSEKDLLSESRRPAEGALAGIEEEKAPVWSSRPILRGVTELGGEKEALVVVFEGARKNQGQMKTRKVGDMVQGYRVAKISDTTMTLVWKDQEEVIDMADAPPVKAARASGRKVASVKVITIGKAPKAVVKGQPSKAAQTSGRGLQVGVVQGPARGRAGSALGTAGQTGGQGNLRGTGRGLGGRVQPGANRRPVRRRRP